jgi:DNA-binding helix-hairpin-helix protein with protein kinase domain
MITRTFLAALFTIFLMLSYSNVFAQAKTPKATKRQINQQERIHQGAKSGELTKRETVRLEAQQKKIQKDKVKAKSDGVVTPKERAKLQAEQNKASRTIYRKKHNTRTK